MDATGESNSHIGGVFDGSGLVGQKSLVSGATTSEALRQSCARNPERADAWCALGEALLSQCGVEVDLALSQVQSVGSDASAEVTFRDALRLAPENANALCGLGDTLFGQGRSVEAEAAYRDALRLDPDFVHAHNGLASALDSQGRYIEAEVAFREVLRLDPAFVSAHHGLVSALREQGGSVQAEAMRQRALQLDPEFLQADSNLCNALAYQHQHAKYSRSMAPRGSIVELALAASTAYCRALQLDRECAEALIGTVACSALMGEAHACLRLLRQSAAREPLDPVLALEVALLSAACGEARAVDLAARVANEHAVLPAAAIVLARLLRETEMPTRALAAIQSALRACPKSAELQLEAARQAMTRWAPDEAQRSALHALELDPLCHRAWMVIAEAAGQDGDWAACRQASGEALRCVPGLPEAERWLGEALLEFGQPEQALPLLESAGREPKLQHVVRVLKAAALELLGRRTEAIHLMGGERTEANRKALGRLLKDRGHAQRAAELFSEIVSDFPGDIEARHDLAECWIGLGQTSQARALLAKMLVRAPDDVVGIDLMEVACRKDRHGS
jgi:tetratricopeptide (TPR) repeat protein